MPSVDDVAANAAARQPARPPTRRRDAGELEVRASLREGTTAPAPVRSHREIARLAIADLGFDFGDGAPDLVAGQRPTFQQRARERQ